MLEHLECQACQVEMDYLDPMEPRENKDAMVHPDQKDHLELLVPSELPGQLESEDHLELVKKGTLDLLE